MICRESNKFKVTAHVGDAGHHTVKSTFLRRFFLNLTVKKYENWSTFATFCHLALWGPVIMTHCVDTDSISIDEVQKAMTSLKNGKSPGIDRVQPLSARLTESRREHSSK